MLEGLIEAASGNYEQARFHCDTALHLAQAAKDKGKIARAHYWLATIAGKQERMDLATEHSQFAMNHFEEIGDRLQLEQSRAELAGMYLNVRQFGKVLEPAEKALRFFEQIKHDRLISVTTSNLAEAYLETGNLDKAKEYAFRVLQLENPRSRPYALYTLGHVHRKQEALENAETCFKEGIQVSKQNEDIFIEAYLQRALGQLYRRLQYHNRA
jgi:tetratricopeptide (TPR) repeat protein